MKKSAQKKVGLIVWIFIAFFCGNAWSEEKQPLPVKVVGLFSSGVGYFQHAGTVTGEGEVELTFRSAQINDVLKSLVVEDLSGGQPGFVLYPSQDPQSRLLNGFQIDLSNNPSLSDILHQLRGAGIRIEYQGQNIVGTLLGVEQRPLILGGSKKPVSDWVVNLATEAGLMALPLKDLLTLELTDSTLRADLKQALATLDQGRGRDRKPLTLHFPGGGSRPVRVGYVVETPVWKTSYRLILPKEGHTAQLQGWAIVENQSNNDWQDVRLYLVSGQPLSFIQDLYQPRYLNRPEVAALEHNPIAPRRYGGGMKSKRAKKSPSRSLRALAPGQPSKAVRMDSFSGSMPEMEEDTSWERQHLNPAGADVKINKEGALFQYVVEGVDLPSRRGAMIPIVSNPVMVEKVSIYNHQTLANHPLNGVLLKNNTGKHLPAGPVTLYEGGFYAGDARLDDLPANQERLLSHAVDMELLVLNPEISHKTGVTSGKIVAGVLIFNQKQMVSYAYSLENRGKESKTVILEHPKRSGWPLVTNKDWRESTPQWHRFRKVMTNSEKGVLTIHEEQINEQRMVLLHNASRTLFAQMAEASFSKKLKKALEKCAHLKQSLEITQKTLRENSQRHQHLIQEQQRIQANLASVQSGTKFHNRMISKLDKQETSIEQILAQSDKLRLQEKEQQIHLENYLKTLNVE